MSSLPENYKYDIAFSLCKQDLEFAKKIINHLNISLKTFLYDDNQDAIIGKSGPEVFGAAFKKESRVVVILSRKEWGDSYYTEIEKNAILDRTFVSGYAFLIIIPMEPNEIPTWYPPTRIYANPQRFTIEDLAKFIEFKVAEEGGIIKQVTLEEKHQHLLNRIAEKKQIIRLQSSETALAAIKTDLTNIENTVKQKIDYIEKTQFWATKRQVWLTPSFESYFAIDNFLLEIKILIPDEMYQKIVTTQDYTLSIQLYWLTGLPTAGNFYEASDNKKLISSINYKYFYSANTKGWATPISDSKKQIGKKEVDVLFSFRDPNDFQVRYHYYDLKKPTLSDMLIDHWFQELLKYASGRIEKHL